MTIRICSTDKHLQFTIYLCALGFTLQRDFLPFLVNRAMKTQMQLRCHDREADSTSFPILFTIWVATFLGGFRPFFSGRKYKPRTSLTSSELHPDFFNESENLSASKTSSLSNKTETEPEPETISDISDSLHPPSLRTEPIIPTYPSTHFDLRRRSTAASRLCREKPGAGHLLAAEEWFSDTDLCFLRMGSESERANSAAWLAWSCIPELRRWVMTFSESAENEWRLLRLRTVDAADTEAARARSRLRPAAWAGFGPVGLRSTSTILFVKIKDSTENLQKLSHTWSKPLDFVFCVWFRLGGFYRYNTRRWSMRRRLETVRVVSVCAFRGVSRLCFWVKRLIIYSRWESGPHWIFRLRFFFSFSIFHVATPPLVNNTLLESSVDKLFFITF